MTNNSIRITVTGAAGQIGYALLFRIASGEMLGNNTKIHLNLLELEDALGALDGIRMELEDSAFPLLRSITTTADLNVAFEDTDWALLVGAAPRKKGMERADLLKVNGGIFTKQGLAIGRGANPDCRVLVVGNPCNTNALICQSASGLPLTQIYAMTMLDQTRAMSQIAVKAKVNVAEVRNLCIWGNHSPTMFPDFYNATIADRAVMDFIKNEDWLKGEFLNIVQQRGAEVINARGASSAASAANAIVKTVRELSRKTPSGECFSVAVPSNGAYGVPEGIVFGYPICADGSGYVIIDGITHNEFSRKKIAMTTEELIRERDAVKDLLIN